MIGFKVVNLDLLLQVKSEEQIRTILNDFESPLNPDIESFLKYKAVEFSKSAIAKTYLVMASYQGANQIAGYFSVSGSKSFVVKTKGNEISKSMKRRFNKFGTYDAVLKQYHIAAPLIGQLGKNYKYEELITGDELLTMAVDMLRHVQSLVGGKFIYLECENNEKLIEFYIRNGFKVFGERSLDSDEQDFAGHMLIQLLKYL